MIRLLEIDCCFICPYLEAHRTHIKCKKSLAEFISDIYTVPEHCPLPTYIEYVTEKMEFTPKKEAE